MTELEKQMLLLRDLINDHFHAEKPVTPVEPVEPISNFRVEITSSNRVDCSWTGNIEGLMDIEYFREGEQEWVHSVAKYREPISTMSNETSIGFNGEIGRAYFRAVVGGWVSDVVSVESEKTVEPEKPIIEPEKPIVEPEKPVLPDSFFHGWWDSHWADNSGMNIIKVDSVHLNDHPKDKKKIVMLSGFRKDMTNAQIRSRIRGRINMYDRDDISMIILHDEPYYGGLSPEQVQYIADEAKKAYRHPVAMTFARGEINNIDRPIPHSLDACSINFYPFYVEGYNHWINDEATFNAHLQGSLNRIKQKGFTGGVFLVGQVFQDSPDNRKTPKYRKPPVEAIDWYFRAAQNHKLAGLLWFEWRNRQNWVGANTMPDILYQIKSVKL